MASSSQMCSLISIQTPAFSSWSWGTVRGNENNNFQRGNQEGARGNERGDRDNTTKEKDIYIEKTRSKVIWTGTAIGNGLFRKHILFLLSYLFIYLIFVLWSFLFSYLFIYSIFVLSFLNFNWYLFILFFYYYLSLSFFLIGKDEHHLLGLVPSSQQ